jgi:S-adenosylmethionine synthetase
MCFFFYCAVHDVKMQSKSSEQGKEINVARIRKQEEIKKTIFFSIVSDSVTKKAWF